MPTLQDIKRQIDACPEAYIFWTEKEVKALPGILDKSETIKAVTSGMLNGKTWLAVCTNRRLIFINRGMVLGVQQVQMPLDRVQSIDHQFKLFFGSISIYDGVNVTTINMVRKKSILPFVKATEEAMYALRQAQTRPAPQQASAAPQVTDIAGQISKLAELKEKGHLTEEEFQTQKKKLLGT